MRQNTMIALALGVCTALLFGCGGGAKSVMSNTPPSQTVPVQSGAHLVLTGSMSAAGGPQFMAHVRRVLAVGPHRLLTFSSVIVTATLYPADASSAVISNSISIATSTVPTSASVSLSNVPVHNNEWALMTYTAKAADGSEIALGELGGLINVASSTTNTATLTETTSQTLQVFLDLIDNGILSTNDLDTNATLASTLHTDIGAAPVDPTTHLFSGSELQTLYNTIAPKFERNATISASPAVSGSFVVLRDYTNASELDLSSNLNAFFGEISLVVPIPVIGDVIGGSIGFGSFTVTIPPHTQLTSPQPVPLEVEAYATSEAGTITLHNVYGGHILVGATNNAYSSFVTTPPMPPFNGGFTSSAGHAPGTFSVTVPTASTQQVIAVNDPAGFAFGPTFFASQPPVSATFLTQPHFGNVPLSATAFSLTSFGTSRVAFPTTYSAASNKITVDTFNPFDIATTNMEICGGITCWQLAAAPPLVQRPFSDAGTKLTYFAWKAGGKAIAIAQGSSQYNVTVSGPGGGTLTTSTPAVLLPRQAITISSTNFATGTWTISATDGVGNTYTDSVVSALPGSVTVDMDSVGNTIVTKSIVITFPTATSFALTSILPE